VPVSSGRPEWLAHRLIADVRATDAGSGLRLQGRLLEILGSLPAQLESTATVEPAWLPVALRALDDRADRPPLAELARACGVHPAHLCRAFRAHMGCSIGEYARQSRVSRARTLLLASDLGLAEIAAECGFADQAHFCREFKRRTGRSPGAFRRAAGS
jgi:AraC family transcriptional regulator